MNDSAAVRQVGESSIEGAKARVGPMRSLLARHGLQVRRRLARCPFPDHDDRNPSASLYIAADGDERIHCHSCGRDEDTLGVAHALGERVTFPRGAVRPRSRLSRLDPRLMEMLARRSMWPFEWEAAKVLARLDGRATQLEILRNWRYFADRGDVRLIVEFSTLIRGVAMLRSCTARSVDNPSSIELAVRQLVEEVEGAP